MPALTDRRRSQLCTLMLLLLPVLVHLPALTGWLRFDPIYIISGVTTGTHWAPNGVLSGYPGWIDGNAGVTTQALGALAAHDWLHGILPWWNPYSGAGLPLAAEAQNSAFFLPFVLLLAAPHGLLALRMVVMAAAGLSTRALLLRLGCSTMPALVGAALFELNGTFAWLAHGPIMPIAFLPMLLLGLEQAREAGRWPPLAIPFGMAWSLLAGFPETAFIDGLLALAWAALRLCQSPRPLQYAIRVGIGGITGLLLAAPGVWPFIEALPRELVGIHAGPNQRGMLAGNIALLLFPYIYGDIFMGFVRAGAQAVLWFSTGGYADLALVTLAAFGLRWRGRDRALRCLLAAWVLLTFLRAIAVPGVVDLFNRVPLLRQAAFHMYVSPSWSMALSVLAAFALQDWRAARQSLPLAKLAAIAGAIAVALWLGRQDMALLWGAVPGYAAFPLASIAAAAAMLALIVRLWTRPATRIAQLMLAGAVIANAGLLFTMPLLAGTRGRHVDVASIQFLQAHAGLLRIVSFGPLTPNYGAMFGLAEINHNYLPVPTAWVDYVRHHFDPAMDGVNFNGTALPSPPVLEAYQGAGVQFALTPPGTAMSGTAIPVWQGETMTVWKLPHPAAYFQAPGCAVGPASRQAVTLDCPQPSSLTRLELAWPGWRATVNGAPVQITTKGIFQAVDVPKGHMDVVFAYAPPGIAYAWAMFTLGLFLLAATALGRRLSGRHPGAS